MQKNESNIMPFLPLFIFMVLSLSNGIAQVAAGDAVTGHEQGLLKIIEYGIGISVAVSVVTGVIASVREGSFVYILGTVIVILLINMIMPIIVKYIFALVIACLLMVGAMFVAGPLTSLIIGLLAHLTGTLGTLMAVAFLVALIISNSVVGGW